MNVTVKSNVKHNGVRYEAGQTIENIDETAGQRLIHSGVAEDTTPRAKTSKAVEAEVNQPEASESEVEETEIQEEKLEDMTKPQLLALAAERGIEVPKKATNKQIVALLKGE